MTIPCHERLWFCVVLLISWYVPMLYIQCIPLDSIFSLVADDCKDKITLNERSLTYCIAIKYCVTLITVLCVFAFWSCLLRCPLRFPNGNNVRFVLTSSGLYEDSCLMYVICVCLRIVMSNIYCVVCLFCFSLSCVPYIVSFSGVSIFECHFSVL